MRTQTMKGVVLASAVGALFAAGQAHAATHVPKPKEVSPMVRCAGVNGCKGQGACASASNGCAGQNGCKGKGWVEASLKECKAKGGTVVAEEGDKHK
jgi:hypothetical protein